MSEPELSVPLHWSTSTGVRQIWVLSRALCVGGVGLCSILGSDETSYWQPGSPSHWRVCLMVHTQPAVGLSDPVLTPRVECVTTCFCLCCGLLRVGWWGHDKGGVGVGCGNTSSVLPLSSTLTFSFFIRGKHRNQTVSPHHELNTHVKHTHVISDGCR